MLIYGTSGHARVIYDLARLAGVTVDGFVDSDASRPEFEGLPVLAEDKALRLAPSELVVAVDDPAARQAISHRLISGGLRLRSLVHPHAIVAAGVQMGPGAVVMAGAIVSRGTVVGTGALVNAGTVIDFDCRLGDYVHIAPGAALGNGAAIGEGTWISVGACVAPGVVVGDWTMVGAGAAVVENLPSEVVASGVPARVERQGRYFAAQPAVSTTGTAAHGGNDVGQVVADVINTILRDTGREPRTFANQDVLMGNIGLDSLDLAVMTVSLEQRTGVDPFRSGRGAVRCFGDLVNVYEEALRGAK